MTAVRILGTAESPLVGAEDLAFDAETGWLFVSATDRRAIRRKDPAARGGLYRIDIASPDMLPVDITPPGFADSESRFFPQGIDVARHAGRLFLYAINHARGWSGQRWSAHRCEILKFAVGGDGTLEPRPRRFTSPRFEEPNDLTVVAEDRFFVSDPTRRARLRLFLGWLLGPPGKSFYFDGKAAHGMSRDLAWANGLLARGHLLYAAPMRGGHLLTLRWDRDEPWRTIAAAPPVPVGKGLDNITLTPDGALLVAGHPSLWRFLKHRGRAAKGSPSRVVRIELGPEGLPRGDPAVVFEDPGTLVSAASVGLEAPTAAERTLFLGTVFSRGVAAWRLPADTAPFSSSAG